MHPFRAAIEARDVDAVVAMLSDQVVFNSPVVFRPYAGRDAVKVILTAVMGVFEDFEYLSELRSVDGRDHALVFRAGVGDRKLHGCDFLHHDGQGQISEFTVMVRPLSAALALRDAMAARLGESGGQ